MPDWPFNAPQNLAVVTIRSIMRKEDWIATSAWVMIALIVLHVAAALFH